MPRRVGQAAGDEVAQVVVMDRLAGGQPAVAEQQERPALPHPRHLAAERLEERGRPHDGPGQAAGHQLGLEGQLGLLEGEQGLLHADGRQQHDAADAGRLGCRQRAAVRPVVDGPGVGRRAGARGQAGHQGVDAAGKTLAPQPVTVGRVAKAQRRAGQQALHVGLLQPTAHAGARAHQARHVVPGAQQRPHGGLADGAGGAEDSDAHRRWPRQAGCKASSSASTQCLTGVAVPLCRCWMQPTLAETMALGCNSARLTSLRSRSCLLKPGCSTL